MRILIKAKLVSFNRNNKFNKLPRRLKKKKKGTIKIRRIKMRHKYRDSKDLKANKEYYEQI